MVFMGPYVFLKNMSYSSEINIITATFEHSGAADDISYWQNPIYHQRIKAAATD
jgi:hypothetical protein